MNKLATKLIIAMLLTALLSAVTILASQEVGQTLFLRSLPLEDQAKIAERREARIAERRDFRASLSGENRDDFNSMQIVHRRSTTVGIAVAGLVASLAALGLAKRISRPIEDVTRASLEVAKGDLATRVKRPTHAGTYVSEEVQALAENFNQMATSLELYEEERTAMIANIAHDLRTPLTAIQVRLEALQEDLVPFNQAEVSMLLSQTELLNRLITDLRTLSLADAQKLSLNKQSFNLSNLVATITDNYKLRADEKQIDLSLIPFSKEVFAYADSQRVTQVLDNLLINALQATPKGGTIRLDVMEREDEVLIGVEDSGQGIPETLVPVLFDRFIQGKDKTGSSGLGLAIVKTLVNLQSGSVKASNRADGGARFEFSLPLLPLQSV